MIDNLMVYYPHIKFIHLFSVMIWSMSAVGAYVYYFRTTLFAAKKDPHNMELQRRLIWAYEQFDKTVVLEHIAFPVVLITGLLMFFMAGWSIDSQWLLIKLVIVIGFFIPLEILDVWISHVLGPRISKHRESDVDDWNQGRALHWKFLKIVSPWVGITIPLVIFLAVVKPAFW